MIEAFFTKDLDVSVWQTVDWSKNRMANISEEGRVIYQEDEIYAPKDWSDRAINIVASKYFAGKPGSPGREKSIKDMIYRVARQIADWGLEQKYFDSKGEATEFLDELIYILLHQMASFNSPVWFNVGVEDNPQCSACFILSVDDDMDSILNWYTQEAKIFKWGSGTGVNISKLRGSKEHLSSGGTASGPLSFMKAADASAGVIKSGGKTRRSAKMVMMDDTHPDLMDFINCKIKEEKKAKALMSCGYDSTIDGDAYESCAYQNSNHSVRLSDEFMNTFHKGWSWSLKNVKTGEVAETLSSKKIMEAICKAIYECADPGIQFVDNVNAYHTTPNSGPINCSNPCGEYIQVDDSACNLASIKLTSFYNGSTFDWDAFKHVIRVMVVAQDILIDKASYPTEAIRRNSHELRSIGLGYTDLGALLMQMGLPYGSRKSISMVKELTSFMTGFAYYQSALIAEVLGPFEQYSINAEVMKDVILQHYDQAKIDNLNIRTQNIWAALLERTVRFRNAQVTLLAPTGTVSFMMDCDTTGIEPELSLVKYKKLSGGGTMKLVNQSVEKALVNMGYDDERIERIVNCVLENGTIEGCADILEEHLDVFTCAFKAEKGQKYLSPEDHLNVMIAAQRYLSGAISKTINLPKDCQLEDIQGLIIYAWQHGLKGITFYRDGCKAVQPLTVKKEEQKGEITKETTKPVRKRLSNDCESKRHKFSVGGHEGYIHCGLYDDGSLGEIFVRMSKEGSTLSGILDALAITTSIALQHGVRLEDLVKKLVHTRFEPSGFTGNIDIPMAKSIIDYIFKYIGIQFLDEEKIEALGLKNGNGNGHSASDIAVVSDSSVICSDCGSIMIRRGTCYTCEECGSTSGCS